LRLKSKLGNKNHQINSENLYFLKTVSHIFNPLSQEVFSLKLIVMKNKYKMSPKSLKNNY